MPSISKQIIERVRAAHDLVALVERRGVQLTPRGKNYIGLCPFHDDREPSFVVNPERQLWNCFGACRNDADKSGGDVFAFVMRIDGLSFAEAIKHLDGESPTDRRSSHDPKHAPKFRSDALQRVVECYHQSFRESSDAQDYLSDRSLTDPDVQSAFQIGYADGSLLKRLDLDSQAGRELREIGVINGRGKEHFHGCIVVSLNLPDAGAVGLYGRGVQRSRHLYLPGPRRGLFHWQAMKGSPEIILTESIIDALILYQAGFRNVSAVYGTQGFTSDHADLLQRFRVRQVLLCLDNDTAGHQATEKIAAKIRALGIDAVDARVPGGKDPNEVFLALGSKAATDSYQTRFQGALNRGSGEGEGARPAERDMPLQPAVREAAQQMYTVDSNSGAGDPKPTVTSEEGGGLLIAFSERRYRVRGLTQVSLDRLKVNLRIDSGGNFHLDNLNLYSHRSRCGLIQELVRLFGASREELTREINSLVENLEAQRLDLVKRGEDAEAGQVEISDRQREEALRRLRAPNLMERILSDFERVGFVGERTALAVGYLATISRLLEEPLALLIVSRSAAGKSFLQDALCDFVPEESLAKYTRLTGQALFYKAEDSLRNKVLAIAEETGAEEAAYSIRTLQSAQALTIAATGTDPTTGKLRTQEYEVRGPVAIMLTTTSPEALDFETRNRFVQVGIDESREQTRRILARQRESDTLEGVEMRAGIESVRDRQQNIQRLLRPLKVVNPYALQLVYPDERLQMRREQKKYLTLIKAIALLHQHQREVKQVRRDDLEFEYIEVIPEDIAVANRLARKVLGRSLDELAHPTRELLKLLVEMVQNRAPESPQFTRQDVKNATGWSEWQVRTYLEELVRMEYVEIVSGGRGKRLTYELVFDGDPEEDRRYLAGLLDVDSL